MQLLVLALCGASVFTLIVSRVIARSSARSVVALAGDEVPSRKLEIGIASSRDRVPESTPPDNRLGAKALKQPSGEVLLFRAGLFSARERRLYYLACWLMPLIVGGVFLGVALVVEMQKPWLLASSGVIIGVLIPGVFLERMIRNRDEEILFHLPLVLEQIVLGVGSSLDVAPCMRWIVEMADERDSHNPVTELLALSQQYMKSGLAIDESLNEIAALSGSVELKHVFMALSQVVRHGGEISKQLHELANAVATQREVKIEERIKSLEVKATGPVAMIFASFMGLFLVSLGIQLSKAFQ